MPNTLNREGPGHRDVSWEIEICPGLYRYKRVWRNGYRRVSNRRRWVQSQFSIFTPVGGESKRDFLVH